MRGDRELLRHLDGRAAGRAAVHAARLLPRGLPRRGRRDPRGGARSCTASTRGTSRARTSSSSTASGCPPPSTTGPSRFEEFSSASTRWSSCRRRRATTSCEVADARRAGDQADGPRGPARSRSGPRRARSTTCCARIERAVEKGDRVLVTTLTKKMAEDLTDYLLELGVKVQYLHSDIDTIDAHRDPARPAPRGVRRPRRDQPAARGARPPRSVASSRSSTRTRRGSCGRPRRSSRPWGAPRATSTAKWSSTPTPSPTPCAAPSRRPSAGARSQQRIQRRARNRPRRPSARR